MTRSTAIALAVVAAAGLIVGVFGGAWVAVPDTNRFASSLDECALVRIDEVGLRSYLQCDGATCARKPSSALVDLVEARIQCVKEANPHRPGHAQLQAPYAPWHGVPAVGLLTFICALVAAGGLLVGAVLATANQRLALPVMPTTLAVFGLAGAIISGCVFIATKPDISDGIVIGWSFITFGIAAVLGLAAVFPLNRAIRPIDEDLGEAFATMSWGVSGDELV